MSEPTFEFYDKTLLDDVNKGVAHVHEFFRLLALCHTVMPEYKDGEQFSYKNHTVWKFFSATQVLREIKVVDFRGPKTAILCIGSFFSL